MDNFYSETRAETNARLDGVLAMAEELGLDPSVIESEIRSRQGAIDAERAARAEAEQSNTVDTSIISTQLDNLSNELNGQTASGAYGAFETAMLQHMQETGKLIILPNGISIDNNTNEVYVNGVLDVSASQDLAYESLLSDAKKGVTSFGLSMGPVIGDLKDLQESITGKDYITGDSLNGFERGTSLAGAMLPIVGGSVIRNVAGELAKYSDDTFQLLNSLKKGDASVTQVGKQSTKDVGSSFDDLMQQVNKADVSTPKDGAVFWTGWKQGNQQVAMEFAEQNGKYTIEMTPGGKWLDDLDLYGKNSPVTRAEADDLWDALSKQYASQATGKTNVFNYKTPYDSNKVFYKTELPQLKANKLKIKYQSSYLNYLYNR